MSITTYAELQTAVGAWLHRSDLTGIIPDLITLGEKRIFRKARCRVMESALTGTIASGVIAVPSDYLEIKFAYREAPFMHHHRVFVDRRSVKPVHGSLRVNLGLAGNGGIEMPDYLVKTWNLNHQPAARL